MKFCCTFECDKESTGETNHNNLQGTHRGRQVGEDFDRERSTKKKGPLLQLIVEDETIAFRLTAIVDILCDSEGGGGLGIRVGRGECEAFVDGGS